MKALPINFMTKCTYLKCDNYLNYHCFSFSQLFGEADAEEEVSPDTEDPELRGLYLPVLPVEECQVLLSWKFGL